MTCSDFEGYLRTISGAPPLTLPYSLGKDITSLTLTGNAVQNGTPSPETPVEVQGVGERTINLLDVSQFASNGGGYVENGEVYATSYPYQPGITPEGFLAMTGLKEGDTFTTYGDLEYFGTGTGVLYIVYSRRPAGTEAGKPSLILNNHGSPYTATIPDGFNSTNYYNLYIYADGSTDSGLRGIWRNLMIVKGAPDESPPYEPYGYKIPVKFTSDNGDTQTINVFTDKPLYGYYNGSTISKPWGEVVFDGTEDWYINGAVQNGMIRYFLTVRAGDSATNGLQICKCTHFSQGPLSIDWYELNTCNRYEFTSSGSGWFGVCVSADEYPTVDDWKAFVAAQYAAGTPIKAYMTTPDSKTITITNGGAIPRGTLTVTTETDVQPAYISAEYYSMKKE